MVDSPDIHFNHGASVLHEHADRLVQIPTFLDIWRAETSHKLASAAASCHVRRRGRGKKAAQVEPEDEGENYVD